MIPELGPGDALLVVDLQKDFCSGGSLAVADGDAVVPVLNRWIERARERNVPIYASRCWHPPGHASFRERGGPWPPHCVQQTRGAEFHPDLRLPDDVRLITKGSHPDRDDYSAFDDTDLAERLRIERMRRVWIGGLALDYCVRATVLGALHEGFDVHVILDGTRAVDVEPGDGERALEEMVGAGAVIEGEPR